MVKQQVDVSGRFGPLTQSSHLWLVGVVYYNAQQLSAAQVTALLAQAVLANNLPVLVKAFTGFFSIVWQTEKNTYLISDYVASRPLFYAALPGGGWAVSDDFIRLKPFSAGLSALAIADFKQLGWVSGNNTLYQGLSQVRPAEIVCLNNDAAAAQLTQYALFLPQNGRGGNATLLKQDLDAALWAVTQRLIAYAAGRAIVLPLSGGYDSRVIALYLYKLGYKNVITFTFGKASSKEVAYSKRVAEAFGFCWHFVLYSRKAWQKIAATPEFAAYLAFCHHGVSVPNVQVYPAIYTLYTDNRIPKDALIVPGHTGDFVCGGHLPAAPVQVDSTDKLTKVVFKRHFELSTQRDPQTLPQLAAQLQVLIAAAKAADIPLCSVAEAWNWQERQAKFIVNSNRYYDFFQLDWWMPLWDKPLVDFWLEVPLAFRQNKQLWTEFIDEQMLIVAGEHAVQGNAATSLTGLRRKLKSALNYFTDDNALYGLVPFRRWLAFRLKLSANPVTPFSLLIEKLLNLGTTVKANQHKPME